MSEAENIHMPCAGIILCGGNSSRMGYPKALLPFGPELMLQRVARLLGEVVETIIVVAAPGQDLPPLPDSVRVVRDRREGRGPLEGIAAGLAALVEPHALASGPQQGAGVRECGGAGVKRCRAFVTSCDAPLLVPAFVRRMIDLADGYDIAVPRTEGFYHSLAAVYGTRMLPQIEAMLAEDCLKPLDLFARVNTRIVEEYELRDVDPELATLRNCNRAEDYLAVLKAVGFTVDPTTLGSIASR